MKIFKREQPKVACTVCVLAVSQIQRMIEESEEKIIKTLLNQCSLLPEEFQNFCRMVVGLSGRELIAYVKRTIGQPRALCQNIGACRPSEQIVTKILKTEEKKISSRECYQKCIRSSNHMDRFNCKNKCL